MKKAKDNIIGKENIAGKRCVLRKNIFAICLGYQDDPKYGFFRMEKDPNTFFGLKLNKVKWENSLKK